MRRFGLVSAILVSTTLGLAIGAEKGVPAKGGPVYATYCAACHGNAGKGDGPGAAALNPKPRDLTDSAYMLKLNDQYLFDIVSKGGAAQGKSPLMPPWGTALKADDIRNVVAYIRSLPKR